MASVNYYFGDKSQLYDQVWCHPYTIATKAYPLDAGLNDEASPEECLYAFVLGFVKRIFSRGPAGHFTRLMAGDMAEPTQAHKAIAEEAIRPERERLEGIISTLLVGNEMKDQVRLCAMSVISQCLLLNFNRSLHKSDFTGKGLNARQIEGLARHITRFSLAGIRDRNHFYKDSE